MNSNNPVSLLLRFFRRLSSYLAWAGAIALLGMMFLTLIDVTGRYIFNRPILGAFELTEFMILVLIFSFLGYTQLHKNHINVELFMRFFPEKIQGIIEIFNHIACLAIMALITWTGFQNAIETMNSGEASPNLAVPDYPFVFFLVLGCAVMCIEYIRDIAQLLKNRKEHGLK